MTDESTNKAVSLLGEFVESCMCLNEYTQSSLGYWVRGSGRLTK
jgi:hypothetical protein